MALITTHQAAAWWYDGTYIQFIEQSCRTYIYVMNMQDM